MAGERVARQIRWEKVQLGWSVLGLCGLVALGVWGTDHESPTGGGPGPGASSWPSPPLPLPPSLPLPGGR
ncbi:hypothetical protein [Kitasatospora phosalacinea]|uniref:hypothetical protein n=1 Tax=Kitasatospora phosalacinea TaxID=2065 RepID=UPI002554C372|nr:hypothetical protein [Kitasatospora phosalacinea]